MLKIRYCDNRLPPFWAMEKSFSIGRASSNQLSLNDDSIEEHHARIINRGDTFLLKDLGSKLGTFVNDTRITQKSIACGDTITIGGTRLEIIDPLDEHDQEAGWALIADASWLNGQEFKLDFSDSKYAVMGRASHCNIIIPGTHLSREHAELHLTDNGLLIRDLGSANGTFVNDKKVDEAILKPGDRIRVDVYSFKVFGPGIVLPKAATLVFKAITKDAIERHQNKSNEKLWKTRATSPGNRQQEDLYKTNWLPPIIALSLISLFACALGYFIFIA